MDQLKTWPLAFGLVAALALLLSRGAPPEAAKKAEEPAATPAVQESPAPAPAPVLPQTECNRWCEPIRLYEEYFGLPAGGSLGRVAATASALSYKLDVLIALIPDPVDSGMSYRSDEALDALQRGFVDFGFRFDRQWLPWIGDAANAQRFQREPGALLFRRSSKSSQSLTLVLLIGETPKGGLRKAPFREALALAERVRPFASQPGSPVRILGPTFSGAAESLRIALLGWLGESRRPEALEGPPEAPLGPVRFQIVTGSATTPGLEETFARYLGKQVTLERTIVPDDKLEHEAYRYLREELGWSFEDLALLIEADTSYGQGALLRAQSGEAPGFVVSFPSHLSRLRTAREKKGLRDKAPQEEIAETDRKVLDLSLVEEDREPVDAVPQLSALSTAADDLALSNQLQAVCREGARYVGIVATDIQDRLFLAEHVRSYCPDVVLFSFDNHLLGSHPQLMKTMEGALILTSFPLRHMAPVGEPRQIRLRRHLTSELEQGIYLAARRLLSGSGTPEPPLRPWIVAVGHRQLWPIVQLGEPTPGQASIVAGSGEVTYKWVFAGAVIALLAYWLWRTARPVQFLDCSGGTRLFSLVALGTLVLASGVLLVFYALPLWWGPDGFRDGFLAGQVVSWGVNHLVLAVLFAGLVACCALLPRTRPLPSLGPREALAWIGAAVLLLAVLDGLLWSLWVLPRGRELFYARAGDFASGLSPLVSLACLLAAVYTWALLAIRRRRMALIQGVRWPLEPALGKEPLGACGDMAGKLDRMLASWSPDRWFWGGLIVVLLVPLRRLWDIQPIAERPGYGWVFLILVAVGFTLGAIAFYRFVLIWWKLECILELLCHTWLLDAAGRNAALFDWKPLRSFGWRMPRHGMSLHSAQVLRNLTRRGVRGADGAPLAADKDLDGKIREVIDAQRNEILRTEVRARCDLQEWFTRSARTLEEAKPQLPAGNQELVEEVDKFLSLRVVGWIRYVFGQLRYSLISALACGLFVLVGVSAYAFQPKRFLSFGVWILLLAGSFLTLRIFIRMDRNAVLSAIGGSAAGKVSFDRTFYGNLFTYAGIPLLGVILTQFPAAGSLLGDWLQPLLRLLTAS